MEKKHNIAATGIPWYRAEDYEKILNIMEDSELLPGSFAKWQRLAEQTLERIQHSGQKGTMVYIDPDSFPGWCKQHGFPLNASARMQFAAVEARKELKKG